LLGGERAIPAARACWTRERAAFGRPREAAEVLCCTCGIVVDGGLAAQAWLAASWCNSVKSALRHTSCLCKTSYPTHNVAAALALAHHVARAFANTAASQLSCRARLGAGEGVLIAAVQRVLDQLAAVLEKVRAELPARARQVVQRVEIELAGKLSDDTVRLPWSACIRARSLVLAMVAAHG
jgi:hypothetical protein